MMLGFVSRVKAQTTHSEFIKQWDALLKVDDNEKDFRFHSFLESVKEILMSPETVDVKGTIPQHWSYIFSSDSAYMVCSGVLPFQYQKSRLMVLVVSSGEKKSAHAFMKPIDIAQGETIIPVLDLKKVESGFALALSRGKSHLFSVPDLELKILLSRLVNSRNDEEKMSLSAHIWQRLQPLMTSGSHFNNRFDGLDEISTLISPDGKVKLCTWNIEFNDGVHRFFGGLAVNVPSGMRVFELIDNYQSVRSPEQAALTPSKWYGAIYYDLVETKFKSDTYYTLIGYNGNNAFSQIKVVDVLLVSGGNSPNPRFGYPIFTDEKRTRRRLIFEYSNRAAMMLRYDAAQKMIVMDNLAPVNSMYQNDFRYYGPDFSYNGLKFDKGKWVLQTEIDLRNPASNRR